MLLYHIIKNFFWFQKLEQQLAETQPLLNVISAQGNKLSDLLPEDARPRVGEVISKDNNRFEAISDQIIQKAEKFRLSRQKSLEVGRKFYFEKIFFTLTF